MCKHGIGFEAAVVIMVWHMGNGPAVLSEDVTTIEGKCPMKSQKCGLLVTPLSPPHLTISQCRDGRPSCAGPRETDLFRTSVFLTLRVLNCYLVVGAPQGDLPDSGLQNATGQGLCRKEASRASLMIGMGVELVVSALSEGRTRTEGPQIPQ